MDEASSSPGLFVVVEGIDGSGTTTVVAGLCERLAALGHRVVETREPTSRPIGALLRTILGGGAGVAADWATMALLFAADRRDHVVDCVLPALSRGELVVSDRYDLSSIAYQSATCPAGRDPREIGRWIASLNAEARRPDLTIVVDVSPECAAARRLRRAGAREIYEVDELQGRLATLYAGAEALVPGDRVVHVDGEGTPEAVLAAVLAAVLPLVPASPR